MRVILRDGDSFDWVICAPGGWKRGLIVDTGEGEDHVGVGGLPKGDVVIQTGNGNDTVSLGWPVPGIFTPYFRFGGNVTIDTGDGHDGIGARTAAFKGELSISTGGGGENEEWVSFEYSAFRKQLVVDTSGGEGSRSIVGCYTSRFKKEVAVYFTDGDDRFFLDQSVFKDDLWADGDTGFDTVINTDTTFKKDFTFRNFELIDRS